MANLNSTPIPSTDISRLTNAIEMMDCLAQEGLSEISAIAKLTLMALETPDGYRHPENIAHALRAIWGKADQIENCINSEAEQVGHNWRDTSTERRYAAHREARE